MTEPQREGSARRPDGPSEKINILDYLEIVTARKRSIFFTTGIAFIISSALSFSMPKIYSATAKIIPPQPDQGLMGMMMGQMGGGMAGLAGDILGKGNSADMYVSILKTDAMSDAIIDRFKLMQVYEQQYRVDTYKTLGGNVDIAAGKKDGIISITVEDRDPKRAADMANAYVEELGRQTVRLNVTGAGQNRGFLEERLAKAKGDLARAEDQLKAFQARSKMFSVSDQASATVGGIAQLKAQLVAQEVQLATLQRQFTDSSQEVKGAKTSIANLRGQIARMEGKGSGGALPGVGSVPELGQQYLRVMREFKIQETVVELLTKQYELAKLNEAKEIDGVQVIQQARVPDKKSKPKRATLILAGTFVAFCFSLCWAFIREAGARAPAPERERWNRVVGELVRLRGR